MTTFQIANIRDDIREGSADSGYRVLVDRIWPRGVSKERAGLDEHRKEVAPSNELRKWFGHDPVRFDEFTAHYRAELDASGAAETFARDMAGHPLVTLLYGAKDHERNQAVVLKQVLEELDGHTA